MITFGWTDAFVTMWREEGLGGFYKGVLPALLLTSHGAIQVGALCYRGPSCFTHIVYSEYRYDHN